jgi:HD superfamily phosphodiesterase
MPRQYQRVAALSSSSIATCIREHAFSRGTAPTTLEGEVLQDADRLDAIGAIGIARCMATCAEMRRPFYAPSDPFCGALEPDDKRCGIDHFYRKLLRIPAYRTGETCGTCSRVPRVASPGAMGCGHESPMGAVRRRPNAPSPTP